jgi:branched-chain amino acid transport system substrate-binding protein
MTGRGFKFALVRSLSLRGVGLAMTACCVAGTACAGQSLGPVTDEIGVVRVPKGSPIVIGGYWVIAGPDAAYGIDQQRGAQVALRDHQDKIAGHPARLTVEDDACSAEGGQIAATKLASNPNILVVLGPGCSGAAVAAAPILWRAGIANIGTASTAPSLTAVDRKPAYDGFLRTIYSDVDQGAADAKWMHDVLKANRAVSVHDGSAFSQQLTSVMSRAFKALGGAVVSEEAISPSDVDMHPLLTRIATLKPDVVYLPLLVAASAQILRQSKTISGLEKTVFVGGGSQMTAAFIQAAGPAAVGYRITYPDVSPSAMGAAYPKLAASYKEMFGELPTSGFHPNAYDAAEMAIRAIEKVAVTVPDGTTYIGRKALRDALFKSTFDGTSGPIKCDELGQCAFFKHAVFEFTSADPATFKIGVNPKKIYP